MKTETIETMNRTLRIQKGIGALKVINAIGELFRQSNGDIYITSKEWTEFITPYTELPK
jgi:hypothetical protein